MFSRTPSGIKNTPLFHDDFYLIIVEGESDRSFWSKFFPERINGYTRKLKHVGGKIEVQNHINEIFESQAKFIVATDSDYRNLLDSPYCHSRILETKFHSIENLMIMPSSIASAIRDLSLNPDYDMLNIEQWLDQFDKDTYRLMIADLMVERDNLGKECVGKNCSRFLKKDKSLVFDHKVIDEFLQKLNLSEEEFNKLHKLMDGIKPRFHIRGHFFFSAALAFVSSEVRKIRKASVSTDSFYAILFSLLPSHIEKEELLSSVKNRAVAAAEELTRMLPD